MRNDGVMTIKPGHQTTGNVCVLHAVPYIKNSLRLENTQGNLQSGMPGFNSETRGRFCDGLGSNIVVQYSVGPIIILHGPITATECVNRLDNQLHPMIQSSPKNDAVFMTTMPPFTQMKLFSHGLKSTMVNFSIFSGQHNHQIWTSLNHSGQFWRLA
jgi:hypothetical protein